MAVTKYTNQSDHSLSVAVWLADDEYDHNPVKGPYMSVTALLKPIRILALEQRAKQIQARSNVVEEIDLDRFIASRLGTAIHSSIEHSWTRMVNPKTPAFLVALRRLGYDEKTIRRVRVNPSGEDLVADPTIIPVYMELRSCKKVGKYTIGGKFDFVGNGILEDFKSMGVYGYMQGDKDYDQLMQGSMYRWLNEDIITCDWMRIQQIFTDWSKLEAMKGEKRGYPQQRIIAKKLPLKSVEEIQRWIEGRLAELDSLALVPEAELPRCGPKDLWQKEPMWKYFKNPEKTKRSTKTSDNHAEVYEKYVQDGKIGIIQEVKGTVRRCGYCPGYDLCSQKDEYLNAGILQLP